MTNERGGFLDDESWVRRAQSGDLEAYDELVRRHQRAALRVATAVAGSQRAPDAAQEAFVRAFRSLHRFDSSRPFRPWLLRIVANAAKNELRASSRHLRLAERARSEIPTSAVRVDLGERTENEAFLLDALQQLRYDDRLIIGLRWFEDLSEREIADILGLRPGTVKSRLSRAMDRLRRQVAERGLDD